MPETTARWIAAAGTMLLALSLAACGSSSAPTGSRPAKTGSSSKNYFAGKTITLIAPDKPGGGYDTFDRLIAPYLGKYLKAAVRVVNVPGAGTVVGTNEMASAAPNGLTLGTVSVGGDIGNIIAKKKGQNFDLTKLSWIGAGLDAPVAVFARPQSGFKSFSDLLRLKQPVRVLDVPTGVGMITTQVVLHAFKIPFTVLAGYPSGKSLENGFIRGDGPLAAGSYSSWRALVAGGTAVPLLVTELTQSWAAHAVETLGKAMGQAQLSQAAKTALTTVANMDLLQKDLAGPPGIEKSRLAALRKAFDETMHDPALLAQAKKEGLVVRFVDGATLAQTIRQTVGQTAAIAPYFK